MRNFTLWLVTIIVVIGAVFIFFFIPFRDTFTSDNNTVEIYYADHISAAHQEIIDRFNSEYEGKIRVIPVDLPFSKFSTNELKEMLARSLRSKSERLDVFSVDIIWVPRFAKWAYSLDRHFSAGLLDKINKDALESCYYNNQLVTIPIYIDVGLLYYRRDLLQRFNDYAQIEEKLRNSMTWDEFITLGHRWKETGLPYFIFPADNYEGFICLFHETISRQQSRQIFAEDSVQLNHSGVKRGLKLLHDMIHTWHFTPAVVTEYNETQCINYALEHDALFVRGWPGYRLQYKNNVAHPEKLTQLAEAPMPSFPAAERTGVFGGWNLMISKFSTKKDEALEFIKYTQKERNQITLYEKSGYFPILNTIFEDRNFIRKHPNIPFYNALLNKGRHRPFREDYTQISDILSYYFKLVLRKQLTIDEAIKIASEKINSDQAFIY